MGRCCGGKNAGKPISRTRWYVGHGVFLGYHVFVQGLMLSGAPFSDTVRNLARFHRKYMEDLWHQIRECEGIKIGRPGTEHAHAATDAPTIRIVRNERPLRPDSSSAGQA